MFAVPLNFLLKAMLVWTVIHEKYQHFAFFRDCLVRRGVKTTVCSKSYVSTLIHTRKCLFHLFPNGECFLQRGSKLIFPTWSMGYLISKTKLSELATQVLSFSMWVRKQHDSLMFPARLFTAVLWSLQVRPDMFSYKERNKQVFSFRKSLVKNNFDIQVVLCQLEQA